MASTHSWRQEERIVRQIRDRMQKVSSGYVVLSRGPGIAHAHMAFLEQVPITVSGSGNIFSLELDMLARGKNFVYGFSGSARLLEGTSRATEGLVEGYFTRAFENAEMTFITGPGSDLGMIEAEIARKGYHDVITSELKTEAYNDRADLFDRLNRIRERYGI